MIIDTLNSNPIFTGICLGLLGLIIGSFLNVVIYRLPKMLENYYKQECQEYLHPDQPAPALEKLNLSLPLSHCPHCKSPLKWYHNIPLLSFIILRGKCGKCKVKISMQYPLVEFFASILPIVLWLNISFSPALNLPLLFATVLTWGLITLAVIDWKTQLLPDQITLSFLWLGLLLSIWHIFISPSDAILGAVLGYGLLWFSAKAYSLIRGREGMGHGDFKLLAMLGAWMGPLAVVFVLLIGVFIALIINVILLITKRIDKTTPVAFGPYLAIGGWIVFVWQQPITHLFMKIGN